MEVRYVFMQFPAPSEAFGAAEIEALRDAGIGISVGCMRRKPRNSNGLLAERGLADLSVTYSGVAAFGRGLAVMVRKPASALKVIGKCLLGTWRSPKEMVISLALLPRAFGIAEEADVEGVDVVHLFWGHYPSLVALAIREMRLGTSVSISLGAYDLIREYPLSRVVSKAGSIVTQAEANRGWVARVCGVGGDDVHVVYRGVAVPPDPGPVGKEALILVAERLIAPKKTIDALKVFAKIARGYPGLRLEVLGDGPERATLESWVERAGLSERVQFFGHVPHHEALWRMEVAGVLLSMSQYPGERLPNVVKEAMVRRCACVVTRTPGIEELVRPGYTGFIVEPGDVDTAAVRLREILGDEAVLARMGGCGRRHIKEWFDLEKTTKQRIETWESVLANRKCGAGIK